MSLKKKREKPGYEGDGQITNFRALDKGSDSKRVAEHSEHDDDDGGRPGKVPQSLGRATYKQA